MGEVILYWPAALDRKALPKDSGLSYLELVWKITGRRRGAAQLSVGSALHLPTNCPFSPIARLCPAAVSSMGPMTDGSAPSACADHGPLAARLELTSFTRARGLSSSGWLNG